MQRYNSKVAMNFYTRKLVKPEDLNSNNTLFGGSLLRWVDEESAIYAIVQLGTNRCVTKYMSEINFVSSAKQGDVVEIGIKATAFGRTSLTLMCEVRNKITQNSHYLYGCSIERGIKNGLVRFVFTKQNFVYSCVPNIF